MAAFGSLALSPDPSTAQMGMLLTISLTAALLCALFVLPALLGPALPAAAQPGRKRIRIESAKCTNSPRATLVMATGGDCLRDAPVAVVEPERPETGNPPPRARHGIARDARIMAGIRNRPFGERPSPAAREPRR